MTLHALVTLHCIKLNMYIIYIVHENYVNLPTYQVELQPPDSLVAIDINSHFR